MCPSIAALMMYLIEPIPDHSHSTIPRTKIPGDHHSWHSSTAKKYLKLSACDQKEKDSEDVLMDSKVYRLKILVSSMQEFQAVLLRRVSENIFQYIMSDK